MPLWRQCDGNCRGYVGDIGGIFHDRRTPVQQFRAQREEHDKRERHDREHAEAYRRVTKRNGGILAGARVRVRGHLSICLCCR
jgi:hypothetical protein